MTSREISDHNFIGEQRQEPVAFGDIKLPIDVVVGCGMIKAGCSLKTLLARIEVINQTWEPKLKLQTHFGESAEMVQEPVALETVYETIIAWDEGGKRSRRELARRIVALYTTPPTALNLNCKSVQRRLATSWGYVRKEEYYMARVLATKPPPPPPPPPPRSVKGSVPRSPSPPTAALAALPIEGEEK